MSTWPDAMSQVTDALTSKVGPLPAWAWGLGLGGGIIAFRTWKAKQSTPPAAVTSDGETAAGEANPQDGTPADGGEPGTVGNYGLPSGYQANPGGVIGSDGTYSGSNAPTGPDTNLDWSNMAFDILRAQGYSPLPASEAIRKYLNGEPVTPQEEGMVSLALRQLGQPPEGAPALSRANPSTATPVAPVTPISPSAPIAPLQPAVRIPAAPATPVPKTAANIISGAYPSTPDEMRWAVAIQQIMDRDHISEQQANINLVNLLRQYG